MRPHKHVQAIIKLGTGHSEIYYELMKEIRSGNSLFDDLEKRISRVRNVLERQTLSVELKAAKQPVIHKELYWDLLPPGQPQLHLIKNYYLSLPNFSKYDLKRLEILYALSPSEIWRGREDFTNYHAFVFSFTQSVALECPKVGNALYIIKDDWKELSKLPKMELLLKHAQSVVRVVHPKNKKLSPQEVLRHLRA